MKKIKNMQTNLRKRTKLLYKDLHPTNIMQNVNLALTIFDDTLTAACKSYFQERKDIARFLNVKLA